jgi:hypothetical protein
MFPTSIIYSSIRGQNSKEGQRRDCNSDPWDYTEERQSRVLIRQTEGRKEETLKCQHPSKPCIDQGFLVVDGPFDIGFFYPDPNRRKPTSASSTLFALDKVRYLFISFSFIVLVSWAPMDSYGCSFWPQLLRLPQRLWLRRVVWP